MWGNRFSPQQGGQGLFCPQSLVEDSSEILVPDSGVEPGLGGWDPDFVVSPSVRGFPSKGLDHSLTQARNSLHSRPPCRGR